MTAALPVANWLLFTGGPHDSSTSSTVFPPARMEEVDNVVAPVQKMGSRAMSLRSSAIGQKAGTAATLTPEKRRVTRRSNSNGKEKGSESSLHRDL